MLGGQPAQCDGHPEGEAVPAGRRGVVGELGDPAQPVADRVRVHEQQPGGGLERGALLQVGHEGVEQRVPPADEGLVDVADQHGLRIRVAELTDYTPSAGRDGFTLWVAIALGRLAAKHS